MNFNEIKNNRIPANHLAQSCGVYFLFQGEVVVYVGSSRCISARIEAHKKTKVFDSFSAIGVEEDELEEVEAYYVASLTPKYNKAMPSNSKYKFIGFTPESTNQILDAKLIILGGKVYIELSNDKGHGIEIFNNRIPTQHA